MATRTTPRQQFQHVNARYGDEIRRQGEHARRLGMVQPRYRLTPGDGTLYDILLHSGPGYALDTRDADTQSPRLWLTLANFGPVTGELPAYIARGEAVNMIDVGHALSPVGVDNWHTAAVLSIFLAAYLGVDLVEG